MNTLTINKLRGLILLALIAILLSFRLAQAQVSISLNISSQPLWGPVGYDYVEYYYIPEADVYYYVPTAQFIYFSGGNWIFASHLPSMYSVNLYSSYMVVVNEPQPYMRHTYYVSNYGQYKKARRTHMAIRDSRDTRYYVVKGHPHHHKYKGGGKNSGGSNHNQQRPGKVQQGGSRPQNQRQGKVQQGGSKPTQQRGGNKPAGGGGNKSQKERGGRPK